MKFFVVSFSMIIALFLIGQAEGNTTLFNDDFNDGYIDSNLWTTRTGGQTVVEENGVMKVIQGQTDNGGTLYSSWFSIDSDSILNVERDVKVHYSNAYYAGAIKFKLDQAPDFTFYIHYANYSYSGQDYVPKYGFFISRNGETRYRTSYLPDHSETTEAIWDEWFHERIKYDPHSGILEYYINDEKRLEYNIGILPELNSYKLSMEITPWSWFTGGYHYTDNLNISQQPINQPPIADAGPDQAIIQIGSTIQLEGTQSYDLEGEPITYYWAIISVPEGSNASLFEPTSPNPTFQADIHGDYLIKLVVSNDSSSSEPDQVVVSFENVVPVADATPNLSVVQGETACFDGSGSFDANLDPLSYTWHLTNTPAGSSAFIDDSTAISPCITTDLAGNYEVSLTVNDGWEDSLPSTASVLVITYLDATAMTLQETTTEINNIALDDFKNKNMQKTLTSKVNAALELIDQGSYVEALDKLQNDLLGKTDGCATSGSPDKNDWIEDCTSQGQVYPLIIEAIEYVNELSDESTNNKYFKMLLTNARVGDILLFSQCNGDVADPLNCSAIIPEFLGYGYFSHAAIISEISADSLTYLHAYPGAGINSVTVSSADLVAYTSIMLLTVPKVQDATAIAIVNYGYSSWDGTEYDSNFLPFNSKMYCSELAYDIYNEFGVSLNDASYYPLGLITPDNLLQSGATESVMAYSPIK